MANGIPIENINKHLNQIVIQLLLKGLWEKFDYKSKKGNFTECEIDFLCFYFLFF